MDEFTKANKYVCSSLAVSQTLLKVSKSYVFLVEEILEPYPGLKESTKPQYIWYEEP